MATRRQFITGSVACSALITSFVGRAETLIRQLADHRLAAFVFDDRVAHGPALARYLDAHTDRTFAMRGDVSEVWYDHLAPGLAQGAQAIGGITNIGAMFVLGRLGHDAGLMLALHGRHSFAVGNEAGHHVLEAPNLVRQTYDTAVADGMPWKPALQTALVAAASTSPADRQPVLVAAQFEMETPDTLHSWLLMRRD